MNRSFSAVERGVSRVDRQLDGLESTLKRVFSAAAIVAFGKSITDVASDLTETQNVVDTAFKDSAGEIEQWSKEAINKFGLSELAAKKYASRIMAMSNSMEISHKNGLILSKNIAQLSADLASFYNTDVEGAFEALNSIFTGQIRTLRKYGLNISEANLENYRLSKGIKTAYSAMSEQQKVLLRYNYVMENTRDIQGDFAKTQITFANQTKLLQQNFKSLAGTLGSFLIPVLSTILKYLNAIIVAINSFFGRLASLAGIQLQHFGGGVGLTEDIADGWDNAAGAAAKYKATIAGFDELETLNPQSSGGGGAAGGGLSGEDLFPDGLLSYDVDDNTEALDVSFNHLLELIDNKIQEIREKTDTLASTFGKNVNGIINYVNWPLIGKTVGDGFNLVTSAVNRFMEEIDFHNLGQKFAASVNSIFDTVDFEETGHKLSLKFNAIIDTVNGFIGDLNFDLIADSILTHFRTALAEIKWEQAGETLALGINKIFGFLDRLLNGQIVADFGKKVGEAINTAVRNIDAAQIGRVADGFLTQFLAAIKEIDWKLIGDKLAEAFRESDIIGHLMEAIMEVVKIKINIKGGIFAGLFNLPPGLGKTLYTIGAGLGVIFGAIVKGVPLILSFASQLALLNMSLNAWEGILSHLAGNAEIGATIFDTIKTHTSSATPTLEIFANALGTVGFHIKNFATTLITALAHPLTTLSKLGTVLGGLFKSIIAFIGANPAALVVAGIALVVAAIATLWHNSEEFRNNITDTWENHIKPALEAIGKSLKDLWENHLQPFWEKHLKPLLSNLWSGLQTIWGKISGWIGTVVQVVFSAFGDLIDFIALAIDKITTIIGGIIDVLSGIISFIRGDFEEGWDSAWGGVVSIFEALFPSISTTARTVLNGVVDLINGVINGVKTAVNGIGGWVAKAKNGLLALGSKFISIPSMAVSLIPHLATGGIMDSPTIAMLGEYANAKSNPEIAAPQSLIQAIIDNGNDSVIDAQSQFTRQIIQAIEGKDFYIQIGDDTIAAAAQRGNKNYQRRTGQPLFGL